MAFLKNNKGANRLDLILRCEPIDMGKKYLDFLKIYRNGAISALPLAGIDSYGIVNNRALHKVADFHVKNPPHLTMIRLETSDGNEPGSSTTCPFLSGEIWDTVFKIIPLIIQRLKDKDSICYISESLLIPSYFDQAKRMRLIDYQGEIIRRGDHPDIPVLLECRDEFILADPSCEGSAMMKRDFWSYGTWGYILNKKHRNFLRQCASTHECTDELVQEFFQKIDMTFMVKYELEGIWIVSHKYDASKISDLINVKELRLALADL